MKSKDVPMQSSDLPQRGPAAVGLNMRTAWPQSCNPKMQTIKVHRQGPCLVLRLSPSPHSDQPEDGR